MSKVINAVAGGSEIQLKGRQGYPCELSHIIYSVVW